MVASWLPALDDGASALYERIVSALERDMASGVISAGTKLPPQRDLAFQLKLSVGTVTKAYVEAERRGLVIGHVGRGTFVKGAVDEGGAAEPGRSVDMSLNVIPHHLAARRFAESWASLRKRPDLMECLAYAPPAGPDDQRRAAATWLRRVAGLEVDTGRLLMTTGAQQAMALATGLICKTGDAVLCENVTFYGMKSLAEYAGYVLQGVEMDEEGLVPDALERAAKKTGAKVLYTMPTVHNPTGRTMGRKRREQIAKVVLRHALYVLEDDNYALFHAGKTAAPEPLATIIPDRCFYLGGVSKSLAPGLRLGFLHCPSQAFFEAALRAVRATVYAPPSLGGLFFAQWVEDGSAFAIANGVRDEVGRRAKEAREILGAPWACEIAGAPHIWLPMSEIEAERVAGRAHRAGVTVTPPSAPVVGSAPVTGLRVCLGAAASGAELTAGLERLRTALFPKGEMSGAGMV